MPLRKIIACSYLYNLTIVSKTLLEDHMGTKVQLVMNWQKSLGYLPITLSQKQFNVNDLEDKIMERIELKKRYVKLREFLMEGHELGSYKHLTIISTAGKRIYTNRWEAKCKCKGCEFSVRIHSDAYSDGTSYAHKGSIDHGVPPIKSVSAMTDACRAYACSAMTWEEAVASAR